MLKIRLYLIISKTLSKFTPQTEVENDNFVKSCDFYFWSQDFSLTLLFPIFNQTILAPK